MKLDAFFRFGFDRPPPSWGAAVKRFLLFWHTGIGIFGLILAAAAIAGLWRFQGGLADSFALWSLLLLGACLFALAVWPCKRLAWLAPALLSAYLPLLFFDIFLTPPKEAGPVPGRGRQVAKWDVVHHLRLGGERAYPAVFPTLYFDDSLLAEGKRVLPLSGIAQAKTVLCREADGWASYMSDAYGFNNPDAAWQAGRHALILGDSFVHGACLDSEKGFPGLLRRRYPGVLNLGMSDNGPLLMLATLLEYLPGRNPEAVIWSYYEGNDLYRRGGEGGFRGDLEREWQQPLLRAYLENGSLQNLAASKESMQRAQTERLERLIQNFAKEALANLAEPHSLNDWIRPATLEQTRALLLKRLKNTVRLRQIEEREQARMSADAPGIESDLDLFARILHAAAQAVRKQNAQPIFLYLPSVETYVRQDRDHPLRSRVLSLAESEGFLVIDLRQAFDDARDPLVYFAFGARGGHYSPAGQAEVARVLSRVPPFRAP